MLSRATMLSRSSALRGGARGISRWAQPVVQPKFPHVKIVATIGPASETKQPLDDCVQAGMRIMRINFSHATLEEVEMRLENLAASEQLDPRAVMLDTKGPEIRSGKFGAGAAQEVEGGRVTLVQGDKLTLTTDPAFAEDGTRDKIWVSYKELVDTVAPGNDVLLDDGAVCLRVLEKVSDTEVLTEILNTGELGDRKGVNLPGLSLALPAMSDKDRDDIKLGVQKDMVYMDSPPPSPPSPLSLPAHPALSTGFCSAVVRAQGLGRGGGARLDRGVPRGAGRRGPAHADHQQDRERGGAGQLRGDPDRLGRHHGGAR